MLFYVPDFHFQLSELVLDPAVFSSLIIHLTASLNIFIRPAFDPRLDPHTSSNSHESLLPSFFPVLPIVRAPQLVFLGLPSAKG